MSMLIKASKVIGLPVFTINDGRKIESIEDVIYDPFQNRIEALLIEKGGWFSEAKVILFSDLQGIGEDAAIITTVSQIKKLSDVSKNIEMIAKNDTYLTNTKIITEDGRGLGKVSDIYFDSTTGRVQEFEVSHGSIGNWKGGKKRVKISDIVTIGKDATIVRIDGQQLVKQQETVPTPARTLTQKPADEETPTREMPPEKPQKTEPVAQEQTQDEYVDERPSIDASVQKSEHDVRKPETIKATMKTEMIERRKKEAVGLYLLKNILTPDDKLLAKEGEMVTYRLLELAEETNVLDQVLNNATARIPLTA